MIRKSAQRFSDGIMRKTDGAWQAPRDELLLGFGTAE